MYAPTAKAPSGVVQMFTEDNIPGYIPASDVLTLLGDFNA